MVGNNATVVQKRLDEIRAKGAPRRSLLVDADSVCCVCFAGPKFVCLNDDMNKTHAPPVELMNVLADFYESYYPKPSPFELPDGVLNPEGVYIHELNAMHRGLGLAAWFSADGSMGALSRGGWGSALLPVAIVLVLIVCVCPGAVTRIRAALASAVLAGASPRTQARTVPRPSDRPLLMV